MAGAEAKYGQLWMMEGATKVPRKAVSTHCGG